MGRILRPHGVRGEVRVEILTEDPGRFKRMDQVYLSRREKGVPQPVDLLKARFHQNKVLLTLDGYHSREEAAALRGWLIWVPFSEAIPLEEGEFFLFQLIGMAVWTDDNRFLGNVADIIQTGANEVFVVKGESGKEILIPDTEEVVLEVNGETNKILVHPIPGLLDL